MHGPGVRQESVTCTGRGVPEGVTELRAIITPCKLSGCNEKCQPSNVSVWVSMRVSQVGG